MRHGERVDDIMQGAKHKLKNTLCPGKLYYIVAIFIASPIVKLCRARDIITSRYVRLSVRLSPHL